VASLRKLELALEQRGCSTASLISELFKKSRASEEEESFMAQVNTKFKQAVPREESTSKDFMEKADRQAAARANMKQQASSLDEDMQVSTDGPSEAMSQLRQLAQQVAEEERRLQEARRRRVREEPAMEPACSDAPDPASRSREPHAFGWASPRGSPSAQHRRPHLADQPRQAAWERLLQEAVAEDQFAAIPGAGGSCLRQAHTGSSAEQVGAVSSEWRPPMGGTSPRAHIGTHRGPSTGMSWSGSGRGAACLWTVACEAAVPEGEGPGVQRMASGPSFGGNFEGSMEARTGSFHLQATDGAPGAGAEAGGPAAPDAGAGSGCNAHAPGPALTPPPLALADVEAILSAADRGTIAFGRGGSSSRGASIHELPQRPKPFVVCSSVQSHHASAHGQTRSGTRKGQVASEDRQFSKAALRLSKNPSDLQALGKLASLLGGGRAGACDEATAGQYTVSGCGAAQPRSARSCQEPEPHQFWQAQACSRTLSPEAHASRAEVSRSVSPRPLSVCSAVPVGLDPPRREGCDAAAQGFLVQPGKVSSPAWPPWMSTRATFPTQEQRSQRAACGSSSSPHRVVRCQRTTVPVPRAGDEAAVAGSPHAGLQPLSARISFDPVEAQHGWQVCDGRAHSPGARVPRMEAVRSVSPPLSLCSVAAASIGSACTRAGATQCMTSAAPLR